VKQNKEFTKHFSRDWQLHLFMLLPMIYLAVFIYYPMFGVQIAFKNFQAGLGMFGSPWVGLRHFKNFFNSYQFIRVVKNTFIISLYSLAARFPLSILFALTLNVVRNQKFKKFIQTITYVPHFISIVVVVGIINRLFSPINGAYGYIFKDSTYGGNVAHPEFRLYHERWLRESSVDADKPESGYRGSYFDLCLQGGPAGWWKFLLCHGYRFIQFCD